MLRRIKEWLGLRILLSIEITFSKEGVESINACTLMLSNDMLSVVKAKNDFKSLTHFAKHYQASPLAVCICGRGILKKELRSGLIKNMQVVQQVMPNADPDEYYYQISESALSHELFLVRKSLADPIVSELSHLGFQVLSLVLAQPDTNSAYNAAFQILLNEEIVEVHDASFRDRRAQVFAKAKVVGSTILFASVFVCLLAVGFIISGHFESKANSLTLKKNITDKDVQKFRAVEVDLAQKIKLIQDIGWVGGYRLSWLTDELMADKPVDIILEQFNINPVLDNRHTSSLLESNEVKKVVIVGFCDQASTLNNWLYEIRSKVFVSNCIIVSYDLNKETGKAKFNLHIIIKDYEG